jgi:transposase
LLEYRAVRQDRAKPLAAEIEAFIRAQRERLSPKSTMGKALAYLANHREGLCLYLDDSRVEMDNNPIENLIKPLALNRKFTVRGPRRGRPKLGTVGFSGRHLQAQ